MKVFHDAQAQAFVLRDDAGKPEGTMSYGIDGGILTVAGTHISSEGSGVPISRQLFCALADYVRKQGYKLEVRCPYAAYHLMRDAESYRDVLANPMKYGL